MYDYYPFPTKPAGLLDPGDRLVAGTVVCILKSGDVHIQVELDTPSGDETRTFGLTDDVEIVRAVNPASLTSSALPPEDYP